MNDEIALVFSEGGLLAQYITDYSPRDGQIEMASQIFDHLVERSTLISEAATGIGKTFAYMVPAILSGNKVIISTGTKNLQDQLFTKDIPVLRKALSIPFQAVRLKGRSNYFCHYRFDLSRNDPLLIEHAGLFDEIENWAELTAEGDLSEDTILEQGHILWSKVTSTVDNCLGQTCPNIDDCFINEARKKAQEADIIVINHHLLMSDIALKLTKQGEILPDADGYIIDEAHQLPDIASQFLGNRVSSHQIHELCRDTVREMEQDASDMAILRECSEKLESQLHQFRLIFDQADLRKPWSYYGQQPTSEKKLEALLEALEVLTEQLLIAAERSKGLDLCYQRSENIAAILGQFKQEQPPENAVLWVDSRSNGFSLHITPQTVSDHFNQWMTDKKQAWIFTSATLAVAGKFSNFVQQLGLEDSEVAIWPSPFDFSNQSLLYLPEIPVEPKHPDYLDYIIEISKQMVTYSGGRTFLLFTSYRALKVVAEALVDLPFPILVQGSASKDQLLSEFRRQGNAILLGTNSFWEGVDVKGEALSCVLIDKIPFSAPDDPILEAKIDYLRARGGNPFYSIQIPSAIIQLKQGIGRLIRDSNDYGVLVLCDPRLLTKPYGKLFLQSLPTMPITQDHQDIKEFFDSFIMN